MVIYSFIKIEIVYIVLTYLLYVLFNLKKKCFWEYIDCFLLTSKRQTPFSFDFTAMCDCHLNTLKKHKPV
jgi:hypothetical protein